MQLFYKKIINSFESHNFLRINFYKKEKYHKKYILSFKPIAYPHNFTRESTQNINKLKQITLSKDKNYLPKEQNYIL